MENINTPARPVRGPIALTIPALIASLPSGQVIALPLDALIDVLVDEGHFGAGRVRYIAADGTIAVHFGCDPLDHVWEFPADRIRPVRGGRALEALTALLATNPPVACDLDGDLVVEVAS